MMSNWTKEQFVEYAKRSQNLGEPASAVDRAGSGTNARRAVPASSDANGGSPCAGSPVLNAAEGNRKPRSPKAHGSRYSIPVVLAFFAECGLPEPVPEHDFCNGRKWRFDFAWRTPLFEKGGVALEVQGGLFSGGAHVRGAALLKEMEKLNRAAALGWRVIFVTPDALCTHNTVSLIKECLAL